MKSSVRKCLAASALVLSACAGGVGAEQQTAVAATTTSPAGPAPAVAAPAQAPAQPPTPQNRGPLLSGERQLTFEGLRAGEGYFSGDGTQLIFQSERQADNPFYQMYLTDLGSGEV